MTLDDGRPRSREKMLFLSFTYPSFGGSGSQLRAASLVRMLAKDADIYLLIAGYSENVSGPQDLEMEGVCQDIVHLRSPPTAETGGKWPHPNTKAKVVGLSPTDCRFPDTAKWIVRYFQEHQLDTLFVFRFDALHFVNSQLDFFPKRYLDLDELPSRGQAQIAQLRLRFNPETASPAQKTARATAQLMEKTLIPRFHRVFVASAVEAEEVCRQTGFQHLSILPNVYPNRTALTPKQPVARCEILFVGSFFYYPNVDAVLYFCREILPLIQKKKGDIVFRIVGMGDMRTLDEVKDQAGVELMGYQEDLTLFYANASVVVVPLRAGTGTRLKILEAFAYGRVVISTSIGAQGLRITNRKNILLADSPDAFAQVCLEMIEHPEEAQKIVDEAAHLHRDLYSKEALLRSYVKIITDEPINPVPSKR